MPSPGPRKLRKLLVAMTEDEHRDLLRIADGRPLGPLMVAATRALAAPTTPVRAAPQTPLEAWDRFEEENMAAMRAKVGNPVLLRSMLDAVRRELR